MRALGLGVFLIAAAALAAACANAATSHPWCLVIQEPGDGWACGFDTFDRCEVEARAGNTGFCAANPNYPPKNPQKPKRPAKRRTRSPQ